MSNEKSGNAVVEVAALEAIAALSVSNVLDVLTQEQQSALALEFERAEEKTQDFILAEFPQFTATEQGIMAYAMKRADILRISEGKKVWGITAKALLKKLDTPAIGAKTVESTKAQFAAMAEEIQDYDTQVVVARTAFSFYPNMTLSTSAVQIMCSGLGIQTINLQKK